MKSVYHTIPYVSAYRRFSKRRKIPATILFSQLGAWCCCEPVPDEANAPLLDGAENVFGLLVHAGTLGWGSTGAAARGQPLSTQRSALVFGRSCPNPAALIGFQGVFETLGRHHADGADGLGPGDGLLAHISGREEQAVRVAGTGNMISPVGCNVGCWVCWSLGHTASLVA